MRRTFQNTTALAVTLAMVLPHVAAAQQAAPADPGAAPVVVLPQAAKKAKVPDEAAVAADAAQSAAKAAAAAAEAAAKAAAGKGAAKSDAAADSDAAASKAAKKAKAAKAVPLVKDAPAETASDAPVVVVTPKGAKPPVSEDSPRPVAADTSVVVPLADPDKAAADAARKAEAAAKKRQAAEKAAAEKAAEKAEAQRAKADAAVEAVPSSAPVVVPAGNVTADTAVAPVVVVPADKAKAAEKSAGKAAPVVVPPVTAAPLPPVQAAPVADAKAPVVVVPSDAAPAATAKDTSAKKAAPSADDLARALAAKDGQPVKADPQTGKAVRAVPEAHAAEDAAAKAAAALTAAPAAAALAADAQPVVVTEKATVTESNSRKASQDFATDVTGKVRAQTAADKAAAAAAAGAPVVVTRGDEGRVVVPGAATVDGGANPVVVLPPGGDLTSAGRGSGALISTDPNPALIPKGPVVSGGANPIVVPGQSANGAQPVVVPGIGGLPIIVGSQNPVVIPGNAEARSEARDKNRDHDDGLNDLAQIAIPALAGLIAGRVLSDNSRVALNTGDRVVLTQPDGSEQLIRDDNALLMQPGSTVQTDQFADGSSRTTVLREDGSQIVTIRDRNLQVLRRTLVAADGTATALIDDTAAVQPVDVARLPAPAQPVVIAPDRAASEDELRAALRRETSVNRSFTLGQIRNIPEVRALVAPVDIQSVTFDTGSAAIRPDQAGSLAALGQVLAESVRANPREMYMIEGYTDTVGSSPTNLALSDRRAESVALALTEYYGVPPQNMVVQGYGEQFLKVDAEGDIRANRRVAVRRISDLMARN